MKILWIPHTSWKTPQRCNPFCRELSKRHNVHVVSFEKFSSLRDYFAVRYLKNYFYREEKDGEITVHWLPRISPAIFFKFLRDINYKLTSSYIQKIIKENEIDVVISTFVVKPPICKRLIFDAFDDNVAGWREYGINKKYTEEIEEIENEYLKKADEVVVVSSVLKDKIKRKSVLIPNGLDIKKYQKADGDKIRKKLELKGKIIGFIGAQNNYRELFNVVKSAEELKDLTFLIIGNGLAIKPIKEYLVKNKINNVVLTGKISQEKVADYYKAIDIGLCPYIKTPFRDACFSMKLMEYTASGRIVVSTDLEGVKRLNFPNVILVKDNARSLTDGIKKALNFKFEIPREIENYDISILTRKLETILK